MSQLLPYLLKPHARSSSDKPASAAEPAVQQQPALVSPAQQGPAAPSVTEAAAAPSVSDSAPRQPAVPPGGAAAQQPGVRTPAAESLRNEVDALLKQPPPAIPPSATAPPASPDAQTSVMRVPSLMPCTSCSTTILMDMLSLCTLRLNSQVEFCQVARS